MSDNLYFEPPSRLQLVDKLAHLLRFSNTFLVLAGPSGSGVSTVVEQLHHQVVEDDVYILSLDLKATTSLDALLGMLNGALDELVKPQSNDLAKDKLSLLQQKIETLADLQRKLLVSIDNADHLSEQATQSLANLLAANQGEIAVIIAGSQELVAKASKLVLSENLAGNLHTEILSPFNRTEAEEFIQLRFVRGNDFSAKQLSDIYLNSEGYPGRITQMTSQMIQTGKIKLNPKSTLLPMPHIIGIAVLITAITAVSSWQYFADDSLLDDTEQQANRNTKELTLEIVAQDGESASANDLSASQADTASELNREIELLSVRIKAQKTLLEQSAKDSALSQSVPVNSTAVDLLDSPVLTELTAVLEAQPETVERTLNLPSIAVDNTDNKASDLEVESVTKAVLGSVGDELQVVEEIVKDVKDKALEEVLEVSQKSPAKVIKAAVVQAEKGATKVSTTTLKLSPSVVKPAVVKTVGQQLLELTAELKANIDPQLLNRPPLSQSKIQAGVLITESSIVKSSSADNTVDSQLGKPKSTAAKNILVEEILVSDRKPKADLVVRQATAKPVAVNRAKGTKASALLNEDLISSWPASGYTLQLLGARSEASVVNFLQKMPGSEQMYYYQTKLKNRPWNVIIYGQFSTRSAAKSAIVKLPAKLRKLKPWIKSISSVQSAIKK
ncbi:MAG: AAA family ATPase [Pseudomonadales bacterium]|nr:AAA family ATPase [Pseudomonadales bacterium]NRA16035.1 AAA family ATPase [Oceanospirillaceae bacterium]